MIHSALFVWNKWPVLVHWRITQNASIPSCTRREWKQKKPYYCCLRVTELRMKLKQLKTNKTKQINKTRYTYMHMIRYSFFHGKKEGGSAKNCFVHDWYIHTHSCCSNKHPKSSSLSNIVKHGFCINNWILNSSSSNFPKEIQ